MGLENEKLVYILKQYYKGKKDNLLIILLELKDIVIKKCIDFNLDEEQINVLMIVLLHGIDTYSFLKSASFKTYIDIYLDIALTEYKKTEDILTEPHDTNLINTFANDIYKTVRKIKHLI